MTTMEYGNEHRSTCANLELSATPHQLRLSLAGQLIPHQLRRKRLKFVPGRIFFMFTCVGDCWSPAPADGRVFASLASMHVALCLLVQRCTCNDHRTCTCGTTDDKACPAIIANINVKIYSCIHVYNYTDMRVCIYRIGSCPT